MVAHSHVLDNRLECTVVRISSGPGHIATGFTRHESIERIYDILGLAAVFDLAMVEKNGGVANHFHGVEIVRNKNDRAALRAKGANAIHAFLLKIDVPHGQRFVDHKTSRVGVDGHAEGQAHDHAAGVRLEGFIDKRAQLGEGHDGVELLSNLLLGEAKIRGVHTDIVEAGEFGVKSST